MPNKKVIVVGAGIAGLAAAFRLQQAGVGVTVLESSDRVGGRMSTDSRDGYVIERGAQLITSTYRNTLTLVKELGLQSELKPTSPWMAIVKDGKPRRMPSGAMFPIYALTSGLVGITVCCASSGTPRSFDGRRSITTPRGPITMTRTRQAGVRAALAAPRLTWLSHWLQEDCCRELKKHRVR
jgi:protoporphyrinogen oxidase